MTICITYDIVKKVKEQGLKLVEYLLQAAHLLYGLTKVDETNLYFSS
jgi:hypothetical protein